jgi:hypothetical protein
MNLARSCSATQEKMAIKRERTGDPVSSHDSLTDTRVAPITIEFEDAGQISDHAPAEAVERPHDENGELPALGILEHLLVLGPMLRRPTPAPRRQR